MTLVLEDDWLTIHHGDARAVLAELEEESVQTVVTSPPYFGLRDYGLPPSVWGGDPAHEHVWGAAIVKRETRGPEASTLVGTFNDAARFDRRLGAWCPCGAWLGCLGLEPNPAMYVAHIVEALRAVRRTLRADGTLWLNIGDSYADRANRRSDGESFRADRADVVPGKRNTIGGAWSLKAKDRMMIPARVAIALCEDGWWLRDEIVWAKGNAMPSSVADRTTPAHEMVYMLAKRGRYYYDGLAIREGLTSREINRAVDSINGARAARPPGTRPQSGLHRVKVPGGWDVDPGAHGTVHRNGRTAATYRETTLPGKVSASTARTRVGVNARTHPTDASGDRVETGRNKRSVWGVSTQPYPEAHFATFPEKLIEPMILAGAPAGAVVLDPFAGSGTVGLVAQRLGRKAVLIDLSEEYLAQAIARIAAGRSSGEGPAIDMPVPYKDDGLWAEAVS